MKKSGLIISMLLSLLYSQSEVGAIFVLIPPSPTMNGLGGIGACMPSEDPYSSYYNPANGFDGNQGVYYRKSEMRSRWLPNLADDIFLNYKVRSIGLIPKSHPLQFVLTSHESSLDLGNQIHTDEWGNLGDFQSIMIMDGLSAGIKYSSLIKFVPYSVSVGIARKRAAQRLIFAASDNIFYDYGLLFSVPLKIGFKKTKMKRLTKLQGIFQPTFGYSIANIADSITFVDDSDPAPKYLRTGLSIVTSININNQMDIFSWSGARMASDIMVDIEALRDGEIDYQKGFGDINFIENIILSKPDSMITIHRGDEFTFLGIFSIRKGVKKDLSGKINLTTTGYGYRLSGLLKLFSYITKEPVYDILYNHIDIRYDFSKWEDTPGHPLNNTEFEAWTISFNNIDKLILKLYD